MLFLVVVTLEGKITMVTHQLFKDMYLTSNTFGLHNQQTRPDAIIKECGWFSNRCEYLGHGDLAVNDLVNIAEDICASELFIVLSKRFAFGNPSSPLTAASQYHHTAATLSAHAIFAIGYGQIHIGPSGPDFWPTLEYKGQMLTQSGVRHLISSLKDVCLC